MKSEGGRARPGRKFDFVLRTKKQGDSMIWFRFLKFTLPV